MELTLEVAKKIVHNADVRAKEIGIMKSIGATNKTIFMNVLKRF